MDNINAIIELFKPLNPCFEKLYPNKAQRSAVERLLKKMPYDKLVRTIAYAVKVKDEPFAPVIYTPYLLESKLGALIAYFNRNNQQIKTKGKKGYKCVYGFVHKTGEECGHAEWARWNKKTEVDNLS